MSNFGRHPDDCRKCGGMHRYMVPCASVGLRGKPCCESNRIRTTDVAVRYNDKIDYRCRVCGTLWTCRYQFDPGTGHDNVWWVVEEKNDVDDFIARSFAL